ncbi:hypothetical protein QVA66_06855 [Staphylococcus chromogenes]|nr:hypothetical protein [Staphylococcus chromogenes]
MDVFWIVAIGAILLIAIPAGMFRRRIDREMDSADPEARQAAADFQRDVGRGRAGF